ncbi:glycoside hydrolase [Fomitiporia mediterranea MF3/22]|uniref:glycoside hydrolase n=1 Tax=Fomitiporia mediterranea (strain MF3/22) TaxID=694068 RepID=UPI0004407FE7|nr:glycoside hydrolase [Fomitiporia mediterranea MF3/22]EJD05434.1 glycoside hydrolase [Fomitiporia mediterranea MF3/22]
MCSLRRSSSATLPGGGSCLAELQSGSIAATWYAGWDSAKFPLTNLSWSKYTHVIYSFAETSGDENMVTLEESDAQILPTFVSLAHQNNVKSILSVGGWGGSRFYSTAVANEANRTAFVQALLSLVSQYNLDGLDFDWEYPDGEGIGCNAKSGMDASNFLAFLQALRAEPAGANLILSSATSIKPYNGQDGTPLSDVSQFSKVLDYIEIMNYDVYGSWSATVGPNSPLNDTCVSSSVEQQGSAVSAVKAWTDAGFPASQIVLGVASYGHSFSVSNSDALSGSSDNSSGSGSDSGQLQLYPQFNKANQPAGDSWDSTPGDTDVCGNPTVTGGVFNFWGLIQGGFLDEDGDPANGMKFTFDNCSQTPFIYNPNTQVLVSYDDANSFAAKGKFISDTGLAGFAMWQAGGDSDDILLDSIREAMGHPSGSSTGGC